MYVSKSAKMNRGLLTLHCSLVCRWEDETNRYTGLANILIIMLSLKSPLQHG